MGYPTLEQVRAYIKVPVTVLTDDELTLMLSAAKSDQLARCTWGNVPGQVSGLGTARLPRPWWVVAHNSRQDPTQVAAAAPGARADEEATYPDALAMALLRRVQREVAARNLPLGMVGLDASEYGPTRVPYFDAQIEMHEHPYRRQVLA